MSRLRVFTFGPAWGLPTSGPFPLKLLAWLALAGIEFEHVHHEDSRKGPNGKSPWIELDGERIGDSQVIIELLGARTGFDPDAGLSAAELGVGRAFQRMFEEGFHQVLEWELFVHPEGAGYIDGAVAAAVPPLVRNVVAASLKRHFRTQLHARGIARLPEVRIAAIGRADIDALAARLEGRRFLVVDRPTGADLAVFGQLGPVLRWPMKTPVAEYAKSVPVVRDYFDHVYSACFEPLRAAA